MLIILGEGMNAPVLYIASCLWVNIIGIKVTIYGDLQILDVLRYSHNFI